MRAPTFKSTDIKAFLARDWSLPERIQSEEFRSLVRRSAWSELLAQVETLRATARLTNPRWPNAQDDQEDLQSHQQQSERLAQFAVWQHRNSVSGSGSRDEASSRAVVAEDGIVERFDRLVAEAE